MADKLMYIHNDDTQNCHFCRQKFWWKRFDAQLNDSNNQKSLKVPKVVKPMNKKTL